MYKVQYTLFLFDRHLLNFPNHPGNSIIYFLNGLAFVGYYREIIIYVPIICIKPPVIFKPLTG